MRNKQGPQGAQTFPYIYAPGYGIRTLDDAYAYDDTHDPGPASEPKHRLSRKPRAGGRHRAGRGRGRD